MPVPCPRARMVFLLSASSLISQLVPAALVWELLSQLRSVSEQGSRRLLCPVSCGVANTGHTTVGNLHYTHFFFIKAYYSLDTLISCMFFPSSLDCFWYAFKSKFSQQILTLECCKLSFTAWGNDSFCSWKASAFSNLQTKKLIYIRWKQESKRTSEVVQQFFLFSLT